MGTTGVSNLKARAALLVVGLLATLLVMALSACGGGGGSGGGEHQQAKARPLPDNEYKALPPGEYHSEEFKPAFSYRSGLVPRGMAMLGLIGGPLIIVTGVAVLLGVLEEGGVWQVVVIPEFFWELLLGIWPLVRGFNPSALARLGYASQ